PVIAGGFLLWNGQSQRFGFGKEHRPIPWGHVLSTVLLLALVVIVELALYRPV
ncbi:hypothetical protein HQ560_04245, partial [bacterium]|nr:hypothetical protein [bacterium]